VNRALILVHGSPRDEDEYVTNIKQVSDVFSFLAVHVESDVCGLPFFFGHTHMQGLYLRAEGHTRGISPPLTPMPEVRVGLETGTAYLINPGSVGQPRDGDPRAAYAIFNSETREVALRRVPYNHQATARKIVAAGLPNKLAFRLAFGR
jgi:diadenosine tetraphosphatase ApaH/serine/threonine PP2A family protein phosphatase